MEAISKKCVISIIDHVGRKAGMDYYSGSLAVGLTKIGCDVGVYSNFVGLDTDRVGYFKCYDSHSNRGLIVKIWRFFSATFKASKEAKKRKSDLVIMHLFSANTVTFILFLIPKIFRLNIAVIAHDVSSFINGDNRFLQKIIYNVFANQIVVHNGFSKKMLLQSVDIKDPSKIAIIKHGGYIEHIKHRYTKNEARRELGLDEKGRYILFFGQIKRVKGLDILLKALKETPEDIKLIIAGRPQRDDIAYYDRLIDELALQGRVIKIIRYIEDDEREKLFFAADVNVLPYRIIYQSGVLLMAMSYGLPVIASDLEPNKEIIRDNENGMFFKNGDIKLLSQKINLFFSENILRKKIIKNSIKTIEDQYSWDAISAKYLQLIKKRVSIIGIVGLPAQYGGFETLTQYLVQYLKDRYDFTVFCSAKSYEERLESYGGAKLRYINLNANGVQSILYDIISIFRALRSSDTLLILGVSGCIILPFVKSISHKKIVVNIDGLEWRREKWGRCARLFLKFSEKIAVKWADVIISDNKAIQDYILEEYGVQSKLIAYGADHVKKLPISVSLLKKYPFLKKKYAFSVCRIEPENNIQLILDAFSHCETLDLIIVGNWQNSEYGRTLKEKYSKYSHIHLLDAIYDSDILGEIRSNCTLYLHGHSAGGTNPSLVEAMHLELPVFAFDVAYNRVTTQEKAYYFKDAIGLEALLRDLDTKELEDIASDMRDIAHKEYIWEKIAHAYANIF